MEMKSEMTSQPTNKETKKEEKFQENKRRRTLSKKRDNVLVMEPKAVYSGRYDPNIHDRIHALVTNPECAVDRK